MQVPDLSFACRGTNFKESSSTLRMAIWNKHIANHRTSEVEPGPLSHSGFFVLEILANFKMDHVGHMFYFLFLGFEFPLLNSPAKSHLFLRKP